jgi:hypothetical protein
MSCGRGHFFFGARGLISYIYRIRAAVCAARQKTCTPAPPKNMHLRSPRARSIHFLPPLPPSHIHSPQKTKTNELPVPQKMCVAPPASEGHANTKEPLLQPPAPSLIVSSSGFGFGRSDLRARRDRAAPHRAGASSSLASSQQPAASRELELFQLAACCMATTDNGQRHGARWGVPCCRGEVVKPKPARPCVRRADGT